MKLLHLEHVEDLLFDGHFINGLDTLWALRDCLAGKSDPNVRVSTKYDGAPAIVFGTNPENGLFFIGTKSVFNKRTPKIIYTPEDADRLYENDINLAEKLKLVFTTLRDEHDKRMIPSGVFQGDLMFTEDTVEADEKLVIFTANTITYHLHTQHPVASDIKRAKLGLVVHTEYDGETLSDMKAHFTVDQSKFFDSSVCFIDPTLNVNNYVLTDLQRETVDHALNYSEQAYRLITDRSIFNRHGKFLRMFTNQCVRIGEPYGSIGMYRAFLTNRKETELAEEAATKLLEFNTIFAIHRHLTMIKKVIITALETSSLFYHEVDGKSTNGEGFVVSYHGIATKLVDRLEFSRLNFMNKKFVKEKTNG